MRAATKPPRVTAIYPGSFDPITNGHLDLIERGCRLFDKLIVAILRNETKQPLFSVEERIEMLREVVGCYPNVVVDSFDGLLVDYAAQNGGHSAVARHPGDFGLRVRAADGINEPPASARYRNGFYDGQRSVLVHQFAAGEGSLRVGRQYHGAGAAPVEDRLRKRFAEASNAFEKE